MNAAQVAEDGDTGDIFPVEGEDARGLLIQRRAAFRRRIMLVDLLVLVLPVIGHRYLGQESGDHLDDVGDRHRADLVLLSTFRFHLQGPLRAMAGSGQDFLAGKGVYVAQISNLYSAG